MEITKAVFVKSASNINQIDPSEIPEFAVIGRSNVGKSSIINMLTWVKDLAKCSNKPWKTQLINLFLINDNWTLVDLPWYWYAKTWVQHKISWMNNIQKFFTHRKSLLKVFLLIDVNIPVQKIDMDFAQELHYNDVPFDIIATKIDKPTQKDLHHNISELRKELKLRFKIIPNIFLSSSVKKAWRQELLDYIEDVIVHS